ncbi:hypothetical protein [Streptomyces sp. NPDC048172]|uniref:hypothetical protein n=1 Tax=Streptomyces sp. NPDC048172 TaxID=3365505 RepID=UPI00371B9376
MRRTAACLAAVAALMAGLTGCSDDGGKKSKSSGDGPGLGAKDGADGKVTVEFQLTGDSPASVYIPGIIRKNGGFEDYEVEKVKTPWKKKFKVNPGNPLSIQSSPENGQKSIGCKIVVNGEVKDQDMQRYKEGSTLTTGCTTSA